jgi:general secretion pathway protein I
MISLDRHNQYGFTLLEVMVAVAILAIALVGILKANVQSLESLAESREMTTASLLAANKLAEVEAVGAAHWTEFQGDFGENYPGFVWRLESETTAVPGLVRFAITVERRDGEAGSSARLEELLLVK